MRGRGPWRVVACSSCRAPIVWAMTEKKRRRQPFDAEPNPEGNRNLEDRGEVDANGRPMPTAVDAAAAQASLLHENSAVYMPHHVTCPDRERWSFAKRLEGGGAT